MTFMREWLRSKLTRSPVGSEVPNDNRSLVPTNPTAATVRVPTGPLELFKAGLVDQAQQAMRARLDSNPSDLECLQVEGLIALDGGRLADALRVLDRAVRRAPAHAELQTTLGRAQLASGRRGAALASFQRALDLAPTSADTLLQLALLAWSSGREAEALSQLLAAVHSAPEHADANFHLGNLFRGQGKLVEAERHYRKAVAARSNYVEALSNLGGLLKDRGRLTEAAQLFESALRLQPAFALASFNLAMLRIHQQSWDVVPALLRSSLSADPKQADAQYWLGNASMALGDAAEARKAYQAAIRLDSAYIQARWGYAMAQLPAVSQTQAEHAGAANKFSGEVVKLKAWFRAHRPTDAFRAVGAQQPYYLAYIPENHRAALSEYGQLCTTLMSGWATKVGVTIAPRVLGSKCRVGIVSAHIHSHSVWHAILRGWIEHLDPAEFELQVFYTGEVRDAETEWAARRVNRLHHGLGDWTAWAKAISASRADVLIYPEIGMDTTTLRLAALRLARVQLTSWGHPITSGLPTMDGFLSAQAFEPDSAQAHYSETLMPLPRLGCCYQPYRLKPKRVDRSLLGLASNERILLCAGTPFKYAPKDDALLVEIARSCQPCKLVFFRARPEPLSLLLERRLRQVFDDAGLVFDNCVRFVPWQDHASFFGLLENADVLIDSVGFSGFNTAMQAIESATPVVAWDGEFMRGRFASGILRELDLNEWVSSRQQTFVQRVEALCMDPSLRDRVRGQIAARRDKLYDDHAAVASLGQRLLSMATST